MASLSFPTPPSCYGRECRRKPAFLWLVLLGLGVAAAFPVQAQEDPNQRTLGRASSAGSEFIEGVVLNAANNSPVVGVRLELSVNRMGGGILATAFTDKDGHFLFTGLRDSTGYRITARHSDYQEKVESVEIYSTSIYHHRLLLTPKLDAEAKVGSDTVPVWALRIPADASKKYDQGVEELRKGKAKKAIPHLQAAVSLYPDYADAHKLLGTAYSMQADQHAAIEAFQKALEIDPKLPEVAYYLGLVFSMQGIDAEALEYLLQAKSLRPDDWRVNLELGQVYLRMDDWATAEQSLRQAASEPRDSPRLYILLINACALQEKLPDALAAMNDYLERFPKDKFAEQVRNKRDQLKAELAKSAASPLQDRPQQ